MLYCSWSDCLKEVVVEATYHCCAFACHHLQQRHHLTDSLGELESTASIEWRPRGIPSSGPPLQAFYVSSRARLSVIPLDRSMCVGYLRMLNR